MKINQKYKFIGLLSMTALLSACDYNDNDSADTDDQEAETTLPYIYEITLKNITQGQIFSPPALTTHASGITLWEAGQTASVALEKLAEAGDSSELITLSGIEYSQVSSDAVQPGGSQTWTLELESEDSMSMSLAAMLINTNDGFTGITDMDLSDLAIDDSYKQTLMVYDAGTEENDEVEVPGSGGEAYNSSRSGDVDRVAVHAGVLTENELSDSVLLTEHKFDNPAAQLIITRVQ